MDPFEFTVFGSVAASLSHAYTVVDTGETACYNNSTAITAPAAGKAFYGQDAQFAGATLSYTLRADGRRKPCTTTTTRA